MEGQFDLSRMFNPTYLHGRIQGLTQNKWLQGLVIGGIESSGWIGGYYVNYNCSLCRVIHFAVLFTSPCYLLQPPCWEIPIPTLAINTAKPPTRPCGAGSGGWRFQPSAPDDRMELMFGNATAFSPHAGAGRYWPGQCSNQKSRSPIEFG